MEELKKMFLELGYSEKEYVKIVNTYPIKNMKPETLIRRVKDNYDFLISLGYSKKEIIKMTKRVSAIYGYSIENIKQKIEFYDFIGLHSLAVIDSKKLMQSTKLSYARYMFFKEKGIVIDETNYNKLFAGQKRFEKQYGLTKNEMLQKYPYEEWQASANEAEGEKAKEGLKVQSDDEHEKERLVSKILGKQGEVARLEEEISKLESKKNELE